MNQPGVPFNREPTHRTNQTNQQIEPAKLQIKQTNQENQSIGPSKGTFDANQTIDGSNEPNDWTNQLKQPIELTE